MYFVLRHNCNKLKMKHLPFQTLAQCPFPICLVNLRDFTRDLPFVLTETDGVRDSPSDKLRSRCSIGHHCYSERQQDETEKEQSKEKIKGTVNQTFSTFHKFC